MITVKAEIKDAEGNLLGTCIVQCRQPGAFPNAESLADCVCTAIHNINVFIDAVKIERVYEQEIPSYLLIAPD